MAWSRSTYARRTSEDLGLSSALQRYVSALSTFFFKL